MIDARYRTVHRFMPATERHGNMTACGIAIAAHDDADVPGTKWARANDGGAIMISNKGQPFDCKRCRSVLELNHRKDERLVV